jgi:glyoxylase-like metal-dependent hydrolase (beta-lactamase superfamily II)
MKVTAIHTPCHTMTHMCYFVALPGEISEKNPPLLLAGDCLFVAGCGKFFEGTARDMLPQLRVSSSIASPWWFRAFTLSGLLRFFLLVSS